MRFSSDAADYNNDRNVNLNDSLREVPWDSQKVSVAQQIAYTSPQRIICHVSNIVEHAVSLLQQVISSRSQTENDLGCYVPRADSG